MVPMEYSPFGRDIMAPMDYTPMVNSPNGKGMIVFWSGNHHDKTWKKSNEKKE